MYLSKQKCSKRCLLLFPFTGSILHFSSNRIVWTLNFATFPNKNFMYCVQYLVYENSLTAHWKSICKVKLVLLQEVKEPVLRRIGGARGVGGANLKKKFLFLLFAVIQRKSRTCVKYSGEKTLWETGH